MESVQEVSGTSSEKSIVELKLRDIRLSFPIERIMGGDVCVMVSCQFDKFEVCPGEPPRCIDCISTDGFALSSEVTEESILKARDRAIEMCRQLAYENAGIRFATHREIRREVLRELVRKSLGVEFNTKSEILAAKGKGDAIEKLYSKASAAQQKAIDSRCEELGIATIDVLSEPTFSVIEAYAVITELERRISDSEKVPFDYSKLGS